MTRIHYELLEFFASDENRTEVNNLRNFLDYHIFSFIKFFDHDRSDYDEDNYYMEREWRMIGNLNFELNDVCRVFMPEGYAARFRNRFPIYGGQVSFVEATQWSGLESSESVHDRS